MTTTNTPPGPGNPKLFLNKVEHVSVAAGVEQTLLNVTGPGTVESLWMAVGGGNHPSLDGRIRVYYDGSGTPTIDADLGTLLAMHYGAAGAHRTAHVAAQIGGGSNFNLGFLLTYPMPYGPLGIKITYLNPPGTGQTADVYSMATYHGVDTDSCMRLRGTCSRVLDSQQTRAAGAVGSFATDSGGPGAVIHHSYVGGVGATNMSWLERNMCFLIDGEALPGSIQSTGTEDWFDSAWYYEGWKDFDASFHSYVGVDGNPGFTPSAPYVVGQLTDLLSKWGGVPFTNSFDLRWLSESACTTGDSFTACTLWYR